MFPQTPPAAVRVFLSATKPKQTCAKASTDFSVWLQEFLGQDPLSGHLFLFLNRRRDLVKVLFWEQDGLVTSHLVQATRGRDIFKNSIPRPASIHKSGQAGLELSPTDLALAPGRHRRDHGLAP